MRNITAAVGRLPFGKKANVRIVDAKKGLVVFNPTPGKKFEYEALEKAYKRASYGIRQVELTATGIVEERPDPQNPAHTMPVLHVRETGNLFLLRAAEGASLVLPKPGTEVTVTGRLEPGKEALDTLVITRCDSTKTGEAAGSP